MNALNLFIDILNIELKSLQKGTFALAATCWDSNLGVIGISSHLN